MRTWAPGAMAAGLILALLVSCGRDTCTNVGGGEPGYSLGTPAEVLEALALAMETRDIDIYRDCLDESYRFEFIAEDCEDAGIPEYEPRWEIDEDVAAMDSMFSDTVVTLISADLAVVGSAPAGSQVALKCGPSIMVTIEEEGEPDPMTLWVRESWLHFEFVKDRDDTTLFKISSIREELKDGLAGEAASGTNPVTFGGLKALWRPLTACEVSPRSTPQCLFEAFEWAMIYRDISDYDGCLDEAFLFEFTQPDAEAMGLPPEAPWWGKTEDITVVNTLFGFSLVTTIMCDLRVVSGPYSTGSGIGYRLEPDIRIVMEYRGGEPTVFWVNSSWLDIEVAPDPYESGKWVFTRMKEVLKEGQASTGPQAGGLATEPSTFGGIKAMFR